MRITWSATWLAFSLYWSSGSLTVSLVCIEGVWLVCGLLGVLLIVDITLER